MRKFSLAYLTIPGIDPVSQIRIAKKCGYEFVSLRTIPMNLPGEPKFVMEKDDELFISTKRALKEYDMKLMDVELARIRKDLCVEEYRGAFEKAAELGATDILGSVWTRDRSWYTDTAGKIADMAASFGLNYNIEFLPWAGVRNLQEAITLVDDLNKDNVFVMVDTLHAGRAGVTNDELIRTDKKYFRFMHLCDGPAGSDGDLVLDSINDELMLFTAREGRLYAGDGAIDIAGMVSALPGLPLSIELPNIENIKAYGVEQHARNCIEKAKAYLASKHVQ